MRLELQPALRIGEREISCDRASGLLFAGVGRGLALMFGNAHRLRYIAVRDTLAAAVDLTPLSPA